MQFGYFTEFDVRPDITQAEVFEATLKEIDAAESLGMDSVWLAEDHFNLENSPLASPFVIAGAVAARTTSVRIGIGVAVLPLHNPLDIAAESLTMDILSRGRFDLGIGRGPLLNAYKGYNISYDESRDRVLEGLEVIRKAWTEDTFCHEGRFWTFNDVSLVPRPYQKPHPPVWVAAGSEDTYAAFGKLGYPILVLSASGIDRLEEYVKSFRKAWQEAGHPGAGSVMLRIPAYVAETSERARSEAEASTRHKLEITAKLAVTHAANRERAELNRNLASVPYDDVLRQRVIYGTPDYVVERIQEFKERLGISGLLLELNFGGRIPSDRVINSIRLLTAKVMPKFK